MPSFKGIKIETFKPPPIMEVKRPVFEFRVGDPSPLATRSLSEHLAESKVRLDEMKITPALSKNTGVRFMDLATPESKSRISVSPKAAVAGLVLAGALGVVIKNPEILSTEVEYLKNLGSSFLMVAAPTLGMVAGGGRIISENADVSLEPVKIGEINSFYLRAVEGSDTFILHLRISDRNKAEQIRREFAEEFERTGSAGEAMDWAAHRSPWHSDILEVQPPSQNRGARVWLSSLLGKIIPQRVSKWVSRNFSPQRALALEAPRQEETGIVSYRESESPSVSRVYSLTNEELILLFETSSLYKYEEIIPDLSLISSPMFSMSGGELVRDVEMGSIPCGKGNFLLHKNGILKSVRLSRDFTINKVRFPARTRVEFDESGRLKQAFLSSPTLIQGIPVAASQWISFYPNGNLASATLASGPKNPRPSIRRRVGARIELKQDGRIQSPLPQKSKRKASLSGP